MSQHLKQLSFFMLIQFALIPNMTLSASAEAAPLLSDMNASFDGGHTTPSRHSLGGASNATFSTLPTPETFTLPEALSDPHLKEGLRRLIQAFASGEKHIENALTEAGALRTTLGHTQTTLAQKGITSPELSQTQDPGLAPKKLQVVFEERRGPHFNLRKMYETAYVLYPALLVYGNALAQHVSDLKTDIALLQSALEQHTTSNATPAAVTDPNLYTPHGGGNVQHTGSRHEESDDDSCWCC